MKKFVAFLCLLLFAVLLVGCNAEELAGGIGQAYFCDLCGYYTVGDVWEDTFTVDDDYYLKLQFEFVDTTGEYFELKVTVLSIKHALVEDMMLHFKANGWTEFNRITDGNGNELKYSSNFYDPSVYNDTYTSVFDSNSMILRFYLREERSIPVKYIKSDIRNSMSGYEVYLKLE